MLLKSKATVETNGVPVASSAHGPASHQIAQFGPFRVDLRSNELFTNGRKVRLQHQSFQILVMLLEKPGEVVTRGELCQNLWRSQTFVDFDQGLNTAMMRLRHALDDTADMPKFIETLPRHGYRLIAPVTFSNELAESQIENPGAGHEKSGTAQGLLTKERRATEGLKGAKRGWRRDGVIAAVGGIVVVLLAVGLNWGRLRTLLVRNTPAARVPTLAILPFDSLSNDPAQNFLAESMTEQLITELGQYRGLRVLSRGSVMQFSGKHLPLEVVAKDLQADDIFEGSIAQSGGRLRVTGNLYQAATRRHLWAEIYETEAGDGFSPQREISHDIAQKIEAKLMSH
jgi:TolB-like protein/DNA-binding winged helix-turn-helix (wHTH) protein